MLGVLAMLCASTESGAQEPGDRVRVRLLGLRVVEDTVVRWSEDSLFLLRASAMPRTRIVSLDVWRPRSVARSAARFGSLGMGLINTVDVVRRPGNTSPGGRATLGTNLAIGAGLGLAAALVERLAHRGQWIPIPHLVP
jgi:hypothetical protein